ncbi:hypothetical protein F2Q69_00063182 [Brassica cretica]|uniref:Uncharacterized protein n=1 Tax=Brassica cretica TaxID=69181 RepID=A0A8S9RJT8_BRACR|nr:hypothetical protein F2Q69_00063182 [Brassica cretica]
MIHGNYQEKSIVGIYDHDLWEFHRFCSVLDAEISGSVVLLHAEEPKGPRKSVKEISRRITRVSSCARY